MKDKLQTILSDWSARTPKADESLERKIAFKLREDASFPREARFSPWGRLAWFALGAMSAVAIVMSLLPQVHSNGVRKAAMAHTSVPVQRLFNEVERMFAGNLRWIAHSEGEIELGIDPETTPESHGEEPFAVHIAVVSRTAENAPWQKVWESDILTWNEQAIDVTTDKKSDNHVGLWIHQMADGTFAVDSRLALKSPVKIFSDLTDVMQEGKPTRAAVMKVGTTEYRVYQTVIRLKTKEDGPC